MKEKYILFLSIILLVMVFFIMYRPDLKKAKEIIIDSNDKNHTEDINKMEDDFQVDLVLYKNNKVIHYSAYIPNVDDNTAIPLYITLPGYEGLYFQGVGANLEYEDFAISAKEINPNMIILAPQLNDWGETSASDVITLIEYYKENYTISKVYASGYSGGGETMSLVLGKRADLIDAYLHVSSKWDGDYEETVKNRVPVYFFIGENDEYYGSTPTKYAYRTLYGMYEKIGMSKDEIDKILILDVRDKSYFKKLGYSNEHGGGGAVAHEEKIMEWLLTR